MIHEFNQDEFEVLGIATPKLWRPSKVDLEGLEIFCYFLIARSRGKIDHCRTGRKTVRSPDDPKVGCPKVQNIQWRICIGEAGKTTLEADSRVKRDLIGVGKLYILTAI